jgi:hypothetical protein
MPCLGATGKIKYGFVQDRQDFRHAHADGAGVMVGVGSEAGGAGTESLGFGAELAVGF